MTVEPEGADLIEREFGPLLRGLARDRKDFDELVAALQAQLRREPTSLAMQTIVTVAEALLT